MDRPPRTRPPATLASLAAELGISRTTVSNAYNRPDQLSPQLRSRVMEAARRMGYPGPDPVARSLRTRKAGAVGLLLTEQVSYAFRDPGAVAFLEGLTLECDEAQVGLLLVPAAPGSEDVLGVAGAAVDGFVVYSMPDDDPHLAAALARPVPSVICDQPTIPGTDSVGIDDKAAIRAGRRAPAGPRSSAHRRDLHAAGSRPDGRSGAGRPAARRALPRAAEPADRSARRLHRRRGRLGPHPGGRAVRAFGRSGCLGRGRGAGAGSRHHRTDCDLGRAGLGAIEELTVGTSGCPEDVSVTGFDGIRGAIDAHLTTVVQPVVEKGRQAGRMLLNPARRTQGRRVVLPTTFLPGRTTAPPRV